MPMKIHAASRPPLSAAFISLPPSSRRRRTRLRTTLLGLTILCGFAAGAPQAAEAPVKNEQQQPSLLTADKLDYNEATGVVTASGKVELSQGLRTARADKMTYNKNTSVVTASGHVRLVEPSGDIVFADYVELSDDMANAFADNIRVLMTDNGRMAGNEGERRGGRLTRINHGVYSPCDLCKEDPTKAPLWQITAARVVHDKEEQTVRYRDAFLEMFGIPILYTPYLSHPDPTVDRKSGFLTPSYGHKSDLGMFVRSQYYFDIAPDQDATMEVGLFAKSLPLLGGEYRKRFENGSLLLSGAVTKSPIYAQNGDDKGDKLRGYIAAKGLWDLDETWRAGFDILHQSDTRFLRKYYGIREDVLTSKAFIEGFYDRNYAAAYGYAFQDTRIGNNTAKPLVLPQLTYSALGAPGQFMGGRWSFDTQMTSLYRNQKVNSSGIGGFKYDGPNTTRWMTTAGWQREMVGSLGLVTTLDATVLAAFYDFSGYSRTDDNGTHVTSGFQSRFQPRTAVTMRYPFVSYGEQTQQVLEPKVALSFAPRTSQNRVPNEDSIDFSFDTSTLFMPTRYTGYDRLDTGLQATYGLRWAINGYNSGAASVFVGQNYRFTDQTDYSEVSGLASKASDYVTRVTLQPATWLDLDYRGRFDTESLRARVHSVSASTTIDPVSLFTNFSYRDRTLDSTRTQIIHSSNATVGGNLQIDNHWSFGIAHVQAFSSDPGARTSAGVLTYNDECLIFQTIARRDYTTTTTDSDSSEGSSIFFRLVFKNLGEFKSPNLGSMFGSSSSSSSSKSTTSY